MQSVAKHHKFTITKQYIWVIKFPYESLMSILKISEFLTARVSKLQIAERESEEQREGERPESGNEQRAEA
jgi:hypothetical protein